MSRLSAAALDLLRAASALGGTIGWEDARRATGCSSVELTRIAREPLTLGLLRSADPIAVRPPLTMTERGAALLSRLRRRCPESSLRMTLTSGTDGGTDSLRVVLRDGPELLAETEVEVSSYLLAAIRYLLVLEPGALTADTASSAALRIGAALLPPCRHCAARPARSCRSCVRGVVEGRMREVRDADGWIRLDLEVEPPWTYVPWEMAALRVSEMVALDSRLALVRRLSDVERSGHLEGEVRVLVAVPAVDSPREAAALADEAAAIATAISRHRSADPRLSVESLDGFQSVEDLADAVRRRRPRCVHLLGHGGPDGLVASRGTLTKAAVAEAVALDGVDVVVLASCFGATAFGTDRRGASLAWLLAEQGVHSVVAFEGQAEAAHSLRFAVAFYELLSAAGSVEEAVRSGRAAMVSGSPYYQSGQVVLFGR